MLFFSGEVEIGVGPGGDIAAAAEGLAWVWSFGFAGVVYEEECEVEVALHGSE